MKKLIMIAATVLSLSVIFAAGWASGTGTMKSATAPADADIIRNDGGESPDHSENTDERPIRRGFKIILPCPPVLRGRPFIV